MAKRGKRSKTARFAKIEHYILNSPPFLDLSAKAVRIYLEIHRRYYGINNGEISISCREAGKVAHCSPETAGKCIKELIEHGFIQEASKGIFTVRKASTFRITTEPCHNRLPTHDWKYWNPKPKPAKPRKPKNLRDSTPNLTGSASNLTIVVSN